MPVLIAASTGIVVDHAWGGPGTRLWADLGLAALSVCVLGLRSESASIVGILLATTCFGAAWHHSRWSDRDTDDISLVTDDTSRPAWIRGVITDVLGRHRSEPRGAGEAASEVTRMVIAATQVSDGGRWRAVSGNLLLSVAGDRTDLHAGEAVEAAGSLSLVAGPLNPGEFDYRAFLRTREIDVRLFVDSTGALAVDSGSEPWPWTLRLARIRDACRAELESHLDGPTAALASALILGWRADIDPEDLDAFSMTGTTHLLAISGLQLQALAWFLGKLLRLASVPRLPAYGSVAVATAGYAILVGLAPSVVRSAAMTLAFCLAGIADRSSRPANTLALAGLLCLLWSPFYAFDVGCHLSFLAIAALIWVVPRIQDLATSLWGPVSGWLRHKPEAIGRLERRFQPRWRAWPSRLMVWSIKGMILSAVVWLAAVPLVALRFHLVAPIGILLNVPLIPLTTVALLLGASGLGLGLIWSPLGGFFVRPVEWLLKLTEWIVRSAASVPWGHRFVAGPTAWSVASFYVLLTLAVVAWTAPGLIPGLRRKRAGAISLAAIAVLIPGWILAGIRLHPPPIEGDVLAVGHGLAVSVRLADGTTILYDCGRMGDPNVGRRIIAPALWSRGITRIDQVFLSHADLDHYNGLPDLLDRFAIGEVLVPPGFGGEANPGALALLDDLQSRGIPVRVLTAPTSWRRAGVDFTVLHPPANFSLETSDNARSLVLDLAHAGSRIVLTGDVDAEGTAALLESPGLDPPAALFLSPHHGGRTANPPRLYQWASPRAVVVSQRPPQAGTSDALSPIQRDGLPLIRTWERGAVHFVRQAGSFFVDGFLDRKHPP